jgi:hypothetical protein
MLTYIYMRIRGGLRPNCYTFPPVEPLNSPTYLVLAIYLYLYETHAIAHRGFTTHKTANHTNTHSHAYFTFTFTFLFFSFCFLLSVCLLIIICTHILFIYLRLLLFVWGGGSSVKLFFIGPGELVEKRYLDEEDRGEEADKEDIDDDDDEDKEEEEGEGKWCASASAL